MSFMIRCDVKGCDCSSPVETEEDRGGTISFFLLPDGWSRLMLFEEVRAKVKTIKMESKMFFPMSDDPVITRGEMEQKGPEGQMIVGRAYLICDAHDLPVKRGVPQQEIDQGRFRSFNQMFMPKGQG